MDNYVQIKHTKSHEYKEKRIGIDFGGVIKDHGTSKSIIGSFKHIRMLCKTFSRDNVFIVSKAKQRMEKVVREWLVKHQFCEKTGFKEDNIHFVRECKDKITKLIKYKINYFIDDKWEVVSSLDKHIHLNKVFWFIPRTTENETALINKKSVEFRNKLTITIKWYKIYKSIIS